TEYCADAKTNLLYIYSDAPGIYVVYDYTSPLQFHGRTIPGKLAIFENNQQVIAAQLSIADADPNQTALFTPTPQMISGGPGAMLAGTQHFTRLLPTASAEDRVQPTVVHGIVDNNGQVKEAIALQSSSVSAAALEAVKQMNFGRASGPGDIGSQRQVF